MGEDPDIKNRYQLIVKALGTFSELCKIREELCLKGFGIYTINDDTLEAMFLGTNLQRTDKVRQLEANGWVWREYINTKV